MENKKTVNEVVDIINTNFDKDEALQIIDAILASYSLAIVPRITLDVRELGTKKPVGDIPMENPVVMPEISEPVTE